MHLLEVSATGFKGLEDNFTISFLPKANKTEEDKEFELNEIDEDLFVFSTVGIVGKNASGKTSVVDLLGLVIDIFSHFRIDEMKNRFLLWNNNINLKITFYYNHNIYRYITDILIEDKMSKNIIFNNQKLFMRSYCKTYIKDNSLLDYSKYSEVSFDSKLPPDNSILFNIFNEMDDYGIYYSIYNDRDVDFVPLFRLYDSLPDGDKLFSALIKVFDDSINRIKMINNDKYEITYKNKSKKYYSFAELSELLSSGTAKGLELYTLAIYCLNFGKVLIVDEIENHFHNTLVSHLIRLFRDKYVNKKGAVLIFTTHNANLLDIFNRSDNIYITKYKDKIIAENMYLKYGIRNGLLKSKKFLKNEFGTNVDYDSLMNLKKELMK